MAAENIGERLWTIDSLGLPEDYRIDGKFKLQGGILRLEEGTKFVDHGGYGSIEMDEGRISVTVLPQKRGLSLAVTRVLFGIAGRVVGLYERVVNFI